jgi:hypothetical protein
MLWFHISDKEKENRLSEKRRWKSYLSRHIYIYLQCSCYWAIQTKKILWMLTSVLTVSQKWSAGFFVFLSSPWVICHVSCMKMMILFLLKSIFLKSYTIRHISMVTWCVGLDRFHCIYLFQITIVIHLHSNM